jgi:hypothetical protein
MRYNNSRQGANVPAHAIPAIKQPTLQLPSSVMPLHTLRWAARTPANLQLLQTNATPHLEAAVYNNASCLVQLQLPSKQPTGGARSSTHQHQVSWQAGAVTQHNTGHLRTNTTR